VPQCSYPPYRPRHQRRNGATLPLALRAMVTGHLIHSALTCPSSANARHLKSRHPFVPAAQQLISFQSTSQQQHTCGAVGGSPMKCGVSGQPYKTPHFHPRHGHPLRNDPPKTSLSGLTASALVSVGRFRSCLSCWCGAEQTVGHVVLQCPIPRPHGLHGLTVLGDETIECLLTTCPEI